jgi:lysyl-tRNA synthetase class 2
MAEERLEEILINRKLKRERLIGQEKVPYPAEVRRTHTLDEAQQDFEQLEKRGEPLILIGRVQAMRKHGAVAFLDIGDSEHVFQLQLSEEILQERYKHLEVLDTGDWLQATGKLGLTKREQRTLIVGDFHIITKSLRPWPSQHFGLKDPEQKLRQREVDLWLNPSVRKVFKLRSEVIYWLRTYLRDQGYIEVETPVLQTVAGGAAARPFKTHHHALGLPLYLRIAAELYLKRLLVGGFEKVFEIERRFRNEGVDRHHNPEFTMLESQWAYADYEDLMTFTEETLEKLCLEIKGSTTVSWQGIELKWQKPFLRRSYIETMNERLGFDILSRQDTASYLKVFADEGLEAPAVKNYYQLVDALYKELVRPTLIQPTLLYDYPAAMVPLAKRSLHNSAIAEKFQLVAAGLELNNCYTELNDPVLQRQLFSDQQAAREQGDEEAQSIEEEYLRALEYGLPPNAGWSLGIDRFVMLLADVPSIRDTILFPLLKTLSHD